MGVRVYNNIPIAACVIETGNQWEEQSIRTAILRPIYVQTTQTPRYRNLEYSIRILKSREKECLTTQLKKQQIGAIFTNVRRTCFVEKCK